MDKANELIDYARSNPVAAGLVTLASVGTVAVVWIKSRGGSTSPAQSAMGIVGDNTTPGAVVQIRNEVPASNTTPIPAPSGSQNPPMMRKLAGQEATPPKGFNCPNGYKSVFGLKPGTNQQTDGTVVCQSPDGRVRPVHKAGSSWAVWRRS